MKSISIYTITRNQNIEQLQKLVSEEWQRNNTDMLSPDEDDTGRTTAEIIQDEVNDPARCAALAQHVLFQGQFSHAIRHATQPSCSGVVPPLAAASKAS